MNNAVIDLSKKENAFAYAPFTKYRQTSSVDISALNLYCLFNYVRRHKPILSTHARLPQPNAKSKGPYKKDKTFKKQAGESQVFPSILEGGGHGLHRISPQCSKLVKPEGAVA